jgi:hypothetical protein
LDGLEQNVDVLFEKAITNVDGGDVERERYYNMALEVDGRVERMEGEMNDLQVIMREMMQKGLGGGIGGSLEGDAAINNGSGGSGDITEIVEMMKQQNEMLNGLEVSCEKMDSELNLVSKVMANSM